MTSHASKINKFMSLLRMASPIEITFDSSFNEGHGECEAD